MQTIVYKLKTERARQKALKKRLEGAIITLADRFYHLEEKQDRSMLKSRADALQYFNDKIEEIISDFR